MTALDLSGLWVPVITPFHSSGNLDLDSLKRLCRRLLTDGATGLVVLGTTGEPATLTEAEQHDVIATCNEVCIDLRKPMLVGVGTNSTQSTIESARSLSQYSAAVAAFVVVPYYTRPSSAGVVHHFEAVAAVSALPIVMYNVPYRTGITLTAADILRIAAIPNVVGVKQSVGTFDRDTLEVLRSLPPDFQVLAGDDAFIAPTILLGGVGAIAAAAHLCTPKFVHLVEAARKHDVVTTVALAELLLPIIDAGFAEPNPAVWKAGLHAQGEISSPSVRLPLLDATEHAAQNLLGAIRGAAIHG
jgi:4-hydroxy-tetrahydrodipicolinate synthase